MGEKFLKLFLLSIFTLVLCGFQDSGAQQQYRDEFNEELDFAPGGSFELVNVSGTVRISGTDDERVVIRAVKTAIKAEGSDQAKQMLDRVDIEVEKSERKIRVATRYPKGKRSFTLGDDDDYGSIMKMLSEGWDLLMDALTGDLELDFGKGTPVRVDYEIELPRRTSVEVTNVDGRVEVREIGDGLDIKLVNGDLELVGVDGGLDAKLVNGTVRITGARGEVEVKTVNGSIYFEQPGIEMKQRAGFKAVNGDVVIGLSETAAVDLELYSLSGQVSLEMPVKIQGRLGNKKVSGTLNGGGPQVEAKVVNGDIRLKKM